LPVHHPAKPVGLLLLDRQAELALRIRDRFHSSHANAHTGDCFPVLPRDGSRNPVLPGGQTTLQRLTLPIFAACPKSDSAKPVAVRLAISSVSFSFLSSTRLLLVVAAQMQEVARRSH
jgi:hypothetical protein